MSSDDKTGLDDALRAWIDESHESASAEGKIGSGAALNLAALLRAAEHSSPSELSSADAARILANVRERGGRSESLRWGSRDTAMAAAAVLAGLALGLVGQSLRPSASRAGAAEPEVVKQASFESVRDGRVVRFSLELKRQR